MTAQRDQKLKSSAEMPNRHVAMFSAHVSENAIARVVKTLRSGYIGEGPEVQRFEEAFRQVSGAPYPVAVNSCTSALHLALALIGVGSGDEVITTAQTFMATSHVILAQNARPVFADVQYLTANIDPADIEHRITNRTRAIIAVHWGGYPCDLDEIHAIAQRHRLPTIEDAAHALGASYKGRPIGGISPYTCFSFQAIKHITTGDGGMLCLSDETTYQAARRRRWFGIDRVNRKPSILGEPEWDVAEVGYKYQMNDIAGSLGVVHLEDLLSILARRAEIARSYRKGLEGVAGITLFESRADRVSANWLFSLHVERREDFCKMMRSKGVEASVVHLRIDRNLVFGGLRNDLPVLEKLTETIVCLPVHDRLDDHDVDFVIQCAKDGW